ncbi:kelch domain-containing protein 9-like [Ylistrum balloti]|uniref:kelch domain-containing protein 9-like n=1 Tax=Ylistrum balloti TaxID=509963 RepID=UPI002905B785|nr:kelch domain-containing protein 9-like [Ylistrum balloti]
MASGSGAHKSNVKGLDLSVDWELVTSNGPSLAFHVGCALGNGIYIHGGIETKDGKQPSDKLFRYNSSSQSWQEVHAAGSPALSHHACVPLAGRYMLLIGGWDGKSRTAKVVAFDSEKQQWLPQETSGFPGDAGLSSHTATLLASGEIIIFGREGSLRMQRRHGNSYILSGSVQSGHFTFKEFTNAAASRSGHTSNIIGNKLYVVGGRENNLIEIHDRLKSGESDNQTITTKLLSIAEKVTPMSKLPGGRKNHITINGTGVLFFHGGDTFDGRSRESVGEMFLITLKPTMQFYKLGESRVRRSGHICCIIGDKVILHGGLGGKNNSHVYSDTFSLEFK